MAEEKVYTNTQELFNYLDQELNALALQDQLNDIVHICLGIAEEEEEEDGIYKCYSCLYYDRAHSADHCTSCDTNFSNYTKKQ